MFKRKKKIRRKKNFYQDLLEAILFAFVVAMIVRNYTFQNFKIPSESMESTLLVGDYLVASKFKYFFSNPKRGDIVTFRYPDDPLDPNDVKRYSPYYLREGKYVPLIRPLYFNTEVAFSKYSLTAFHISYYAKKNVVKRVIGMPGDTLKIVNGRTYINNKLYSPEKEQFTDYHYYSPDTPRGRMPRDVRPIFWGEKNMGSRDNFGPIVVPEGNYFVLGDNRDNSYDSRYWGFLKREEITGTPTLIFFSVDEKGDNGIRWNRMLKLIK